jgi:hypothetical protein
MCLKNFKFNDKEARANESITQKAQEEKESIAT